VDVGISSGIERVQGFSDDRYGGEACMQGDAPTGRSAFSLLFYQYYAPKRSGVGVGISGHIELFYRYYAPKGAVWVSGYQAT